MVLDPKELYAVDDLGDPSHQKPLLDYGTFVFGPDLFRSGPSQALVPTVRSSQRSSVTSAEILLVRRGPLSEICDGNSGMAEPCVLREVWVVGSSRG